METTYNYIVLPVGGMSVAPNPGGGVYPAADAWTGIPVLDFTTGTKIVNVWAHDNRVVIRFSFSGVQADGSIEWGDDIVMFDAPQAEPYYMSARLCQAINFVSGSIALYQIMGQW